MTDNAGMVLDAGAFIALERRDARIVKAMQLFATADVPLVTSAAVVAQVWRGGGQRQVPTAFVLRRTRVIDLTAAVARMLGRMLGASRTTDAVDAHVVFLARERGWPVLTSDPDDLLAIDPALRVERV